jgi:sugar lactone lactonase YvrE
VIDFDVPIYGVAGIRDTVWVEGRFKIHRLDAKTGADLQQLPGFWPTVSDDLLWYISGDELIKADAATGRELATYRPPVLGTTVDEGILWAASEQTHQLTAVDLAKDAVIHKVDLPAGEPKWVEAWEGAIWVVIDGSDTVLRVDPATGKVIAELDGGHRPHSVAIGFGSLWVTEHGSAVVRRFGPDGSLLATIRGPGLNVGITATEAEIWAAGPYGIMAIDPTTNEIGRQVKLGAGDWYGLAYAGSSLWLTSAEAGKLYQIPVGDR